MMKISIAFLAAMSLAASGCHKNKDSESVAKLTEIKGKMCACKDKACSDKVSEELAHWGEEQEKSAGDKPVSRSKKVEAVKEEIARCLLQLEVPGGPGGDGAAGSTDGSAAAPGSADGAAPGSAAPPLGSAAAGSAQ